MLNCRSRCENVPGQPVPGGHGQMNVSYWIIRRSPTGRNWPIENSFDSILMEVHVPKGAFGPTRVCKNRWLKTGFYGPGF
jgi:hypothetical protein